MFWRHLQMFSYSSIMHQYLMAKKEARARRLAREAAAQKEWTQRGMPVDEFTMDKMVDIWKKEELATFCMGKTKGGNRCKRKSGPCEDYCHLHKKEAATWKVNPMKSAS